MTAFHQRGRSLL